MEIKMTGDMEGRSQSCRNLIVTMILWLALCLCSMTVMLYVASHKVIELKENSNERVSILGETEKTIKAYSAQRLNFRETKGEEGVFRIPFQKGLKAEDVVIDNRFNDRQLRIFLKGADFEFYSDADILGDIAGVIGGECLEQSEGVILIIHMDGIYEFHTTMSDDQIVLGREKMSDAYRLVVALDPVGEGQQTGILSEAYIGKELPLEIAAKIPDKIQNPDIRILLTRFDDEELTEDERLAFVKESGADIYICIGLNISENPLEYGITGIYNDEFFIPEYGNCELADALVRNTVTAAYNRALGLEGATDESILKSLRIPAAQLQLGFLTNERERALLSAEEYQNMLAEGIANGIMEVYGVLYEEQDNP